MNTQELKTYKGLGKHHNLRDNMTTHEILLTQLQEETSKKLMVKKSAQGFNEVAQCVDKGSEVAKKTKEHIEDLT
jgi:ABC-type antimicrobial peptide transport system ATPase subunit